MPRPSDLYATLGAPGMYQPTPWTPSLLPNVFVYPPEEDNADIFCLFHSGSASPSTYEAFYGNHPVPFYTQRHPSNHTLTDVTVLDNALSRIQQHSNVRAGTPVFSRTESWEEGGHVIMPMRNSPRSSPTPTHSSRSSSSGAGSTVFPNLSFLVEKEEGQEGEPRPTSRRSSVFGERPVEHELLDHPASGEEHVRPGMKRSQTMTLKSRAAMALKYMGGARIRRTESDGITGEIGKSASSSNQKGFLLHEQGVALNVKQARRKSLVQLFTSSSTSALSSSPATTDFSSASVATPSVPNGDLNPTQRKSMTQLLGLSRSLSADVSQVRQVPMSSSPQPRPSLSSPAAKLSRRKSMTQIFGFGRSASSTPTLPVEMGIGDTDPEIDTATDPRSAALQALEGPASSPETQRGSSERHGFRRSITSPSSLSVTAPTQSLDVEASCPPPPPSSDRTTESMRKRRSFFGAHGLSFLDFHRRPTNVAPHTLGTSMPPSFDSPSDATDSSSSNPTSIDSEPDGEETMLVVDAMHIPDVVGRERPPAEDQAGPVQLLSELEKDQENTVSSRFSLHEPKDFDIDVESGGGPLELAARLDSLRFDQLSFDLELFTGSA